MKRELQIVLLGVVFLLIVKVKGDDATNEFDQSCERCQSEENSDEKLLTPPTTVITIKPKLQVTTARLRPTTKKSTTRVATTVRPPTTTTKSKIPVPTRVLPTSVTTKSKPPVPTKILPTSTTTKPKPPSVTYNN
ncbi:hypothetical protein CHUAL_008618 [Chamberlinius hualienensis]